MKRDFKRVYLDEEYVKCLQKARIEEGFPTLLEFSRHLANVGKTELPEVNKPQPEKRKRGFDFL